MRIFYEPLVILVARPQLNEHGVAAVLKEYGEHDPELGWERGPEDVDGDSLPELMGRLCYGSFGPRQGRIGAAAYHGNILGSGHGSVLEHACFSFVCTRVSRGFTHQMVRHRAGWGYSQESQHFIRYEDPDEGDSLTAGAQEAGVILTGIPFELREFFIASCERAVHDYENLWAKIRAIYPSNAKVKKLVSGAARGLLPNALESRLGMTGNARALRHFCELRGNPDNVLEVRLVAAQIVEIMKHETPAIFQDIEVFQDSRDDLPSVMSTHRKV